MSQARGRESCCHRGRFPARALPPASRASRSEIADAQFAPGSRLAINQPLRAFGVASSLHRDPGRGALNFAEISLAELDGGCRDILL